MVLYRDVAGDDVASGAFEPGTDHAQTMLKQMVSSFPKCVAAARSHSETVTGITGLPDNAIAYRVAPGASHHEVVQAFGVRNRTLVQVAVYHDAAGGAHVSAADLLNKALAEVPSD